MVNQKTKKYRVCLEIAYRKLENELFFITPATSEIHTLDEIGIKIWDLILAGETPMGIGEIVSKEYEVAPETVSSDVDNLLLVLQSKGLLEEY